MTSCTAFANGRKIAAGSRAHVAAIVRALDALPRQDALLVFDDETGRQIDLDLREGAEEEAEARPRGRPRLGVMPREVTLMPRHWDWLAGQRGGASAALRRLVETAMRADDGDGARIDAAYRFLSAIAGDLPGFEEAIRALYAGDRPGFEAQAAPWPDDIRAHAIGLAWHQ